ncbi:MAG: type II toxin-antitoxin system RelE/ParE family toxin [Xanthobacteraceae bacterium]
MRVRYGPRAIRDLEAIYEYLVERSPRGAANVMAAVYAAIEFAQRNPDAAPMIARVAGMRGILVHRYRFKVFYRVVEAEDVIEIVHVRHTSRRPWIPLAP